jgi:hypothetical protein
MRMPMLWGMKGAPLLLLLALAGGPLWAQNSGTMLALDSPVYRYMEILYSQAGMTAPNTARPWSVGEARRLLERVRGRVPGEAARQLAGRVHDELYERKLLHREEHFGFDLNPQVNAEGFYAFRGRTGSANEEAEWIHGYRERLPMLELPLEWYYGEGLYIIGDFALLEEYEAARGAYGQSNYSNWVDFGGPKIDGHFPLRSFLSLGGPWWFVQLGRDQYKWGTGKAENMLVGDTSDFLDALNFKLFSDVFSYSGIAAVLDPYSFTYSGGQFHSFKQRPYSVFIAHRLEATFWDSLTVGMSEALSLVGGDGKDEFLAIRDLNFFYPFHNWMESDRGNSFMTAELKWRPAPGWGIYGEFAMDEFRTAYEAARDGGGGPGIFGWLLGADWSAPLGSGFLTGYTEYAITDPYIYLLSANNSTFYNIRRYWSYISNSWEYIVRPLGFSLGPDARSVTLRLQYEVPQRYSAGLQGTYSGKGEVDWHDQPTDDAITDALTTIPSGTVEHTLLLHLDGEYYLSPQLALQADAYYRYRWNIANTAGATGYDLEFALGLRYTP